MAGKTQKKKISNVKKTRTNSKKSTGSSGNGAKSVKSTRSRQKTTRGKADATTKVTKIDEKGQNREFVGILIIALSILIGLSIYYKGLTGLFGEIILEISTGMAGFNAFFIPPLMFIYGVLVIFYPRRPQFRNKTLLFFLLLITISAIFNAGTYNKSDYINMSAHQYLQHFYKIGREITNIPYTLSGGVLGGVVAIPLCLVFQKAGTIIILGTVSVLLALMITEISVKKVVQSTVVNMKNFKENLTEDYQKSSFEVDEPVFLKELDEPAQSFENRIKSADGGKVIDFPLGRNTPDSTDLMKDIPAKPEASDEPPVLVTEKKISRNRKKSDGTPVPDIRMGPMQDREYQFPPFSCMNEPPDGGKNSRKLKSDALENAKKLEETLNSFGISAQIINVAVGPAFTRFELQPSPGVKVSRIVNLTDDIALSLAAQGIRIEAPIPGKAAVGIEVPNREVAPILLREVIETPDFVKYKSRLAVGLGKDISGNNTIIDLGKMPHLLIAGATGSGKSVCINSIIISLLYKSTPEEVKLLMIDPKVVELGVYNGIPHLLIPVVTDPAKAAGAHQWAVQEMVNRYKLFADMGVRDLTGYNQSIEEANEGFKLPQVVIIIDELADLMMVAPHDVEDSICRLAQMARAAGMHLVIATQRPSVNVITGVIKANIPSRISFAVSSQVDSRTILDMAGAEKLLGKGDMLYYPVGMQKPIRVKGAFVSDKEVEQVVDYVKEQVTVKYDEDIIEKIAENNEAPDKVEIDADELLPQAIDLVISCGQASVSLIQRRFKVGYARAGRIVDQMSERGIISGFEGSKPRRVLISKEQWDEMKMGMED